MLLMNLWRDAAGITIALAAAAHASAAYMPSTLFHGTSIVIQPSNESVSPTNATYYAANFFCYMADGGYLSFGWWVPPNSHGKTSGCVPDSDSFHWYEYSHKTASDLDKGIFDYETKNVAVRTPTNATPFPFPPRALRYHIRALALGNKDHGNMAVSYIDDGDVTFHAVGTRQTLSNDADPGISSDCQKAVHTLTQVVHKHDLKDRLNFQLDASICGNVGLIKQGADARTRRPVFSSPMERITE